MKRMDCLDGLRGVLAVYVTIAHMALFAVVVASCCSDRGCLVPCSVTNCSRIRGARSRMAG